MKIKRTILTYAILVCVLLMSFSSNAQHKISGKIFDKNTGKLIPLVEVFISGTSIGSVSDKNGMFDLNVPYFPCQLIFNHVSYIPQIKTLYSPEDLYVQLVNLDYRIDEVTVVANNKRRKNLRLFYKYFIGEDDDGQYEILNDSVLQFVTSDTSYRAFCNTPLQIKNHYLGYNITLFIKDFLLNNVKLPEGNLIKLNSANGTMLSKLTGYYYYQPIKLANSSDQKEVDLNRLVHYLGSSRHFLKSIYDEQLNINGFKLTVPNDSLNNQKVICENYTKDLKRCIFSADTMLITFYTNKLGVPLKQPIEDVQYLYYETYLYSLGKSFIIRKNGTSPDASFQLKGVMGQKKLVNSLPENYKPKMHLLNPTF